MVNNTLLLIKNPIWLLCCLAVIAFFCIVIIIMLDHPSKYAFLAFSGALIFLLFLFVQKHDYKFRFSSLAFSPRFLDYFFVLVGLILIISNIFDANNVVSLAISIIATFFVPGWTFLRLTKIECGPQMKLSSMVLSFIISLGLSSLIFTFFLMFSPELNSLFLSASYLSISLLPLIFYHWISSLRPEVSKANDSHKEYSLLNTLLLIWIIAFFTFVISILYPQFAYWPGSDIVRHYSSAIGLSLSPDTYGFTYPWFHFVLANAFHLSVVPMWLFQSGLAYLSIMLILSFYLMSRRFLTAFDSRAPIMATIFFSVFAGLGWLYLAGNELDSGESDSRYLDLHSSHNASLWDTGYGQSAWLWFWFRPLTVGFLIFFSLVYLMSRHDLSKYKYIVTASFLILTLSKFHISELVVFTGFLFVLSLFLPKIRLRLRDTAISLIVGLGFSGLLTVVYRQVFGFTNIPELYNLVIYLSIIACVILVLQRYPKRPNLQSIRSISASWYFAPVAISIYLFLLFHWYIIADPSLSVDINSVYAVPLEFYPMQLGVVGILAIIGITVFARSNKNNGITIFVVLFIFALIFGRILTLVNSNFIDTGYWERRILPFVFSSACILASIGFLAVLERVRRQDHFRSESPIRYLMRSKAPFFIILSSLVVGGVLSTLLSVEYGILSGENQGLKDSEIDFINSINTSNVDSTLLTVSERSKIVAEYANLGYIVGQYAENIWPSERPELPLRVLTVLSGSSFIYLTPKDLDQIKSNNYESGFIGSHLLKMPMVEESQDDWKLIEIPRFSPPVSKSNVILVLPDEDDEKHKNIYFAYDILSVSGYNYTTALLSDLDSLAEGHTLVAPSDEVALKLLELSDEHDLQYQSLIVLNLYDSYEYLMGVKDLSEYKTALQYEGGAPLVLKKENNGGPDLIYVNLGPIVREMNSDNMNSNNFYNLLSKVLYSANLTLPSYDFVKNVPAILVSGGVTSFKSVNLVGNLSIDSDSAIIDSGGSKADVKLDGQEFSLQNISKINPINISNVHLESKSGLIDGGSGYYSKIALNDSYVRFSGYPAVISVTHSDGSISKMSGKNILFELTTTTTLARQPTVHFEGLASFDEFYAYGELANTLRSSGSDIGVEGKVSFETSYSDIFTVTKDAFLEGEFIRPSSIYEYNELDSFISFFSLPYVGLLPALLVLSLTIGYHFRRNGAKVLPNKDT